MRKTFASRLFRHALNDERIVVVSCDMGYGIWDVFREERPKQFWNVGASEQAAVGAAVGMALEGKIPFVYSITPFILCRPYEFIRNYLCYEWVPVVLVGSGRDREYAEEGLTHHAHDAEYVTGTLGLESFWPKTVKDVELLVNGLVANPQPAFVSLSRGPCADL
jgi:transketolase